MGIFFEARICRNSLADGDDRTPFSELGTELLIFFNACPKSVESLGYNFTGKARNIYRPFVDFDAGHDPLLREQLGKRRAVQGHGSDSFVEKNHTADGLLDTLGRKEHVTIGAAIVVIGFDLDTVETPLDRPHTLVGRENTLSFCHHRLSNLFKLLFGHSLVPPYEK